MMKVKLVMSNIDVEDMFGMAVEASKQFLDDDDRKDFIEELLTQLDKDHYPIHDLRYIDALVSDVIDEMSADDEETDTDYDEYGDE